MKYRRDSDDARIVEACTALEEWVRTRNWTGLDPYDIWAHPFLRRIEALKKNRSNRIARYVILKAAHLHPALTVKLLKPVATPSAKAFGLFAQSYVKLSSLNPSGHYKDNAFACLTWLLAHPGRSERGAGWGYPFDWQDGSTLISKGTPSAVVTFFCGSAFLDAFEAWNCAKHGEVAEQAGVFLAGLPQLRVPREDEACLSYTPQTKEYVHNASLLAAAYLARAGRAFGRREWIELAQKCVRYSARRQQPDGSFFYFGPEEERDVSAEVLQRVDHYHTGFVIRALLDVARYTNMKLAKDSSLRAARHYLTALFDGAVPRHTTRSLYPIDIHSCSEALLCLTQIGHYLPELRVEAFERRRRVLDWTLDHMRNETGHFSYRRYRTHVVRIPFMRWSQAWMLRALTELRLDAAHELIREEFSR